MAEFSNSGSSHGCSTPAASRCLSDDNKSRRLGPICSMPTGYDIKDSGTRPGAPGFPFRKSGGKCFGTPGPPSFGTDGGHRTVAALAGSGNHPLRTLWIYDIGFD